LNTGTNNIAPVKCSYSNETARHLGPSCVGERLPGRGGRGWLLLPRVALSHPENNNKKRQEINKGY